MAERKLFAGPRIRRLRNDRGLTQTAMAESLGVSPSYLNLIERNQRPLTVQLVVKLASTFGIDPQALQGDAGAPTAALREVFADPLLAGELPGDVEIAEVVQAAPNVASGILKLFRAYREQAERLSDLSELFAREGRDTLLAGTRLPIDEARDVFERRANHFPALEEEAEAFSRLLEPGDDLPGALRHWLRAEHGIVVKVLPVATMPNWRRRYDRHSQRLFVSERLSPFDQVREIAMEACLIRMQVAIAAETNALKLGSDEARRIARFELARYAAHALMMPYEPFLAAARRARYDIDVLRSRFGTSFEQAANRLTMLARPGAAGVPFFMLEVDHAGTRFRRAGAAGFPHAAFSGACPKLSVHSAFAHPGQITAEAVEMTDGSRFLTMSRTLEGPQGAFNERPRRTAILLGCDLDHRAEVVYGSALPDTYVEAGPGCRICERVGCLSRVEPPVTRPLGLDEMVTGLSAFDHR